MVGNPIVRKGLAVGIILLFVGTSVIPFPLTESISLTAEPPVSIELDGTNFTSLVGSICPEEQTHMVIIGDTELSDLRIEINGTLGDNGWYISYVTITITSIDGNISYIKYRLDEGSWMLYTVPLNVCDDGYHIIYAYSIDLGGNQSDAQAEFKIDQTPPITTHEFDGVLGENGWFVSNVIVTLTAEDETSGVDYTMHKLDNGEWTTYTDPFIVTEDGEHTLYYYSEDIAGNEEDINEADFKIDQIPPTINLTIEKIGFNTWLFVADVFDETSGVNRVEFYIDCILIGTVTEEPYEYEFSAICTAHIVDAIVYDNAGNYEIPPTPPQDPSTRVFGIISNPKFTEETISFFAIAVLCRGTYGFCSFPFFFRQLTFHTAYSGYSGYIGEHFICAVFDYGPW